MPSDLSPSEESVGGTPGYDTADASVPRSGSQPPSKKRKRSTPGAKRRITNGLEMENIIDSTLPENERTAGPSKRHATRGNINGEAKAYYNAKYHPMDDVMKPQARQGPSGPLPTKPRGRSWDRDMSSSTASTLDLRSDDHSSSGEGDTEVASSSPPCERTPDLQATRHSQRASAKLYVNYNRKHHPDDPAICGRSYDGPGTAKNHSPKEKSDGSRTCAISEKHASVTSAVEKHQIENSTSPADRVAGQDLDSEPLHISSSEDDDDVDSDSDDVVISNNVRRRSRAQSTAPHRRPAAHRDQISEETTSEEHVGDGTDEDIEEDLRRDVEETVEGLVVNEIEETVEGLVVNEIADSVQDDDLHNHSTQSIDSDQYDGQELCPSRCPDSGQDDYRQRNQIQDHHGLEDYDTSSVRSDNIGHGHLPEVNIELHNATCHHEKLSVEPIQRSKDKHDNRIITPNSDEALLMYNTSLSQYNSGCTRGKVPLPTPFPELTAATSPKLAGEDDLLHPALRILSTTGVEFNVSTPSPSLPNTCAHGPTPCIGVSRPKPIHRHTVSRHSISSPRSTITTDIPRHAQLPCSGTSGIEVTSANDILHNHGVDCGLIDSRRVVDQLRSSPRCCSVANPKASFKIASDQQTVDYESADGPAPRGSVSTNTAKSISTTSSTTVIGEVIARDYTDPAHYAWFPARSGTPMNTDSESTLPHPDAFSTSLSANDSQWKTEASSQAKVDRHVPTLTQMVRSGSDDDLVICSHRAWAHLDDSYCSVAAVESAVRSAVKSEIAPPSDMLPPSQHASSQIV